MNTNIRIVEFQQRFNKKQVPFDWMLYGPADNLDKTKTWARVKDLIPSDDLKEGGENYDSDKARHMNYFWDAVRPAYEAWRKGEELPETGTPLGAWAGVNAAQVKVLKASGLRSVEDVSVLSDSRMGKIALPDMRSLVAQARLFLESRETSELARVNDEQNQNIATLSAQLEAQNERLEAALTMLEAKKNPRKAKAA